MKRIILLAVTSAVLAAGFTASAADNDTTNGVQTKLRAIVEQVQTKIKPGKTTEADLAQELQQLDALIVEQNGAKTDEAAQIVFMKAMLYIEVLDEPEKAVDVVKSIIQNYPETKFAQRAQQMQAGLDKMVVAKLTRSALVSGTVFPDFDEKDLEGKPLSVGSRKGKVVLVDFWATWCPPCLAQLPGVIATYKKHHAEGFEIIGVTLDSERNVLDAFLKKQDGMTWPQYYGGDGWNNKLVTKYGVGSIPFTILIGKDGKIIDTNLRGDDLEKAVVSALANK